METEKPSVSILIINFALIGEVCSKHQKDKEKHMRKIAFALLALAAMLTAISCSDSETYADQKKKERSAINSYLADSAVSVISESQFIANGEVTDTAKNEFVLFETSGVYMQIIRKGCGEKIKNGETATVLCRFTERNLLNGPDSIQLSNLNISYLVDKMVVKNTSGTFSASFDTSSSLMYLSYSSQAVPSGWLVPLSYINIGRPTNENEEIAKVKIIVPHSQGQSYASQYVYPCLYEITYQRGI